MVTSPPHDLLWPLSTKFISDVFSLYTTPQTHANSGVSRRAHILYASAFIFIGFGSEQDISPITSKVLDLITGLSQAATNASGGQKLDTISFSPASFTAKERTLLSRQDADGEGQLQTCRDFWCVGFLAYSRSLMRMRDVDFLQSVL